MHSRLIRPRLAAAAPAVALLAASVAFTARPGPALAQSKTGTTLGQFLNIEPGARNAGMGNAGTAVTDGIETVYFNPGVLGVLTDPQVIFTHGDWFEGISFDYVAANLPLQGFGTLFFSFTTLGSGEIDVRTVDQPLGTGERFEVVDSAVTLGYGRQVTSRFAAGAQLNYVNERIWNSSTNYLTLSVGTVYRLTAGGTKLGFSLANIGTRHNYDGRDLAIQYDSDPDIYGNNGALPGEQFTESYPVPVLFRIGVSVPRQLGAKTQMLLTADAMHPNDNSEAVNMGAEWSWNRTLAVRAGYQTLFQDDSSTGLTLGFGLRTAISAKQLHFDYGWADHDFLGGTQRFSFALAF